jgi:hypothetical protein
MPDYKFEAMEFQALTDWFGSTSLDMLFMAAGSDQRSDTELQGNLMASAHAWRNLEFYLRAASEQIRRIWEARMTADEMFSVQDRPPKFDGSNFQERRAAIDALMKRHREAFDLDEQVLADVHFYLTCWNMIGEYFNVLKEHMDSKPVQDFATVQGLPVEKARYKNLNDLYTLGWYTYGRNQLEHYDERIPGHHKDADLTLVGSLPESAGIRYPGLVIQGARIFVQPTLLDDGFLVIGPKRWDVSPASYSRLQEIVAELEVVVRAELVPRAIKAVRSNRMRSNLEPD